MSPKNKKSCWCNKPLNDRLTHYQEQLQQLETATPKERVQLLRAAKPCFVRLLCESGVNVLKGNIRLPDDQYQKLKPHRKLLLYVSKRQNSLKQRQKALVAKKGGFLPVILPVLLSAISGFAGQAISRAVGLS